MFSAKINRPERSERGDLPRRERECGFDRENNLDRPLLPPPGSSLSADDFFNGKLPSSGGIIFLRFARENTVCGVPCAHRAIRTIDMFHLCRWHIRARLCAPYFSRASCSVLHISRLSTVVRVHVVLSRVLYMCMRVCVCVCNLGQGIQRKRGLAAVKFLSATHFLSAAAELPRFGSHCIPGTRNLPSDLNYASSYASLFMLSRN